MCPYACVPASGSPNPGGTGHSEVSFCGAKYCAVSKNETFMFCLSDPPVDSPEAAAVSRKPVLLAVGNIHGGDVDGKEALRMFGRVHTWTNNPSLGSGC